MPKYVLLDELHLRLHVPEDLPERRAEAILNVLKSPRFNTVLRQTLKAIISHFPALGSVRIRITR